MDVVNAVEVSHDHVLGTLECSRHEFDGTPLEVQVEEGGAKVARWGEHQISLVPCRNPSYYCTAADNSRQTLLDPSIRSHLLL